MVSSGGGEFFALPEHPPFRRTLTMDSSMRRSSAVSRTEKGRDTAPPVCGTSTRPSTSVMPSLASVARSEAKVASRFCPISRRCSQLAAAAAPAASAVSRRMVGAQRIGRGTLQRRAASGAARGRRRRSATGAAPHRAAGAVPHAPPRVTQRPVVRNLEPWGPAAERGRGPPLGQEHCSAPAPCSSRTWCRWHGMRVSSGAGRGAKLKIPGQPAS